MQKADFINLLREKKLKATGGRVALLGALWNEKNPASVQTLVRKVEGAMDEATVYRALESLATAGIIRRVDLGHSHAHYEFEKSHHHHIVCKDCGDIEEISNGAVEKQLAKMLQGSKRFKSIYSHNLEFFGNCKNCLSGVENSTNKLWPHS